VVEDLAVVAEHPLTVGGHPGLHRPVPVDDPQPLGAGQQVAGDGAGQLLAHLAARRERAEHPVEQGRLGADARDERDPAHVRPPGSGR
jgi:hypothetical protein